MLAVDLQKSTIEDALSFYQKHLESLREQQEKNLPRNGKAPASADDLLIDHAFDEKLQAIASILISTDENPEQTIWQIKSPSIRPPNPLQIVKPKILNEFDTEPYINPFTGQLITPNTPFAAGSSSSHINANVLCRDRNEPHILDQNQPQQTAATLQHPLPPNPRVGSAVKEHSVEPDVARSRPPSYKSIESVRSFDTRSVVPAARSYASQPAVSEEVPIPKSRWGTISRLKHMSGKASFNSRSKTHAEGLQKDDLRNGNPSLHDAAVLESSLIDSSAKPTDKVDIETYQSLDQHRQAAARELITKDGRRKLLQNIPGFRRHGSPASSNQTAIESEPPAPSIIQHGASRSMSDVPNDTWIEGRQCHSIVGAPEIHSKSPPTPVQYPRTSPSQPKWTISAQQEANQALRDTETVPETSIEIVSEPAPSLPPSQAFLGWTEQTMDDAPTYSNDVSEHILYEESLRLALELSGGFPQEYASLRQIQEEHEMSAQFLESQRVAKELAAGLPQDYATINELRSESENTLEKLRLADIEWQKAFEADRKMAQSLAAQDIPQQIQDFQRIDRQHQLELQEEARTAREIAEREDHAEMEAQLKIARRLQEEWNASEANQIAHQQRTAQVLSEREDPLERKNAELQRLQAKWDHSEPMQRSIHDVDTRLGDHPPAHTSQTKTKVKSKFSGSRPRMRPSPPQQQASSNASSNRDAEELSRIISERRARHGQWQADVQKANQEAKEKEEAIRKRAREDEEEIRRLEQQQRSLAEKARKEEEAKRAAIEAELRSRQAECTVCRDAADKSEMAILPCKHAYHGNCIAEAFQHALGAKKPFKCCRKQVPVDAAAPFLPNGFVSSYRDLVLELATPNPTYCSHSSCSAWIPPPHIKGDTATCPRCSTNTCKACRAPEHPGVICARDVNGQKLLGLANSKKWQRCPHCKDLMEKASGCLHMTCRCGTESCYNCGGIWSRCGGICPRR